MHNPLLNLAFPDAQILIDADMIFFTEHNNDQIILSRDTHQYLD